MALFFLLCHNDLVWCHNVIMTRTLMNCIFWPCNILFSKDLHWNWSGSSVVPMLYIISYVCPLERWRISGSNVTSMDVFINFVLGQQIIRQTISSFGSGETQMFSFLFMGLWFSDLNDVEYDFYQVNDIRLEFQNHLQISRRTCPPFFLSTIYTHIGQ